LPNSTTGDQAGLPKVRLAADIPLANHPTLPRSYCPLKVDLLFTLNRLANTRGGLSTDLDSVIPGIQTCTFVKPGKKKKKKRKKDKRKKGRHC
jgi:hypothetical protein